MISQESHFDGTPINNPAKSLYPKLGLFSIKLYPIYIIFIFNFLKSVVMCSVDAASSFDFCFNLNNNFLNLFIECSGFFQPTLGQLSHPSYSVVEDR